MHHCTCVIVVTDILYCMYTCMCLDVKIKHCSELLQYIKLHKMRTLCIKCMYICKRYVCNLLNNIQMVNIVVILCEMVAPFLLNSTSVSRYNRVH